MSERKAIVSASIWIVVAFGLTQLSRLGSNLIVTRLLEPEMFGIMAIIYIIMHGLGMFSDLGLWAFIVRHKEGLEERVLNTVWTMQVIRGWMMYGVLIFATLVFVALKEYYGIQFQGVFEEDELPSLILVVGVTAVINGYKTMAPAVMSRDLKRARLEMIQLFAQLSGISVMIYWAWISPNIWALVSASIVSAVMDFTLTFFLFPVRHHFTWDKKVVREVYDFGKWIVIASILTYIAAQGDRLFFGMYITPAQLGVYSIGFMLAGTITTLARQLSFKVWFPFLSKAANKDRSLLKSKYYKIRLRQDMILFLTAGFIIATAPDIVKFLYDIRYIEAGWVLQVLALSLVGESMTMLGMECLSALGVTKYRMKIMLVRSAFLFIGLPICFFYYDFPGAVYFVAINVFWGIPIIYMELKRNHVFSFLLEIRALPLIFLGYIGGLLILDLIDYLQKAVYLHQPLNLSAIYSWIIKHLTEFNIL